MMMTMPRHVVPSYTKKQAEASRRAVQTVLRLRSRVSFCDDCDAFHVLFSDDYALLDELHSAVLTKIAMGLRDPEISADLGISLKQVEHAVGRLMSRLNAISRTNLVAIAIALGIINPNAFIALTKEGHVAADGTPSKNV